MNWHKATATMVVMGVGLMAPALRAQGLELVPVPADWPADVQADLTTERKQIQSNWEGFLAEQAAFVSAYAGTLAGTPQAEAAAARRAELKHRADDIVDDADRFNERVAQLARPRAAAPAVMDRESRRVIEGILALAREKNWSAEKQARLAAALHELGGDGVDTNAGEIQQTWGTILARREDPVLSEAAAGGAGPAWASAGVQTNFSDCAIFALANATGRPYGYVAAVATGLLEDATWRSAADRAHPRQAIERAGLNGGEVIMLAETFGQAEVVRSTEFAQTLRAGRPIMINVIPSAGAGAHEVVLTKTFSHGGETWFEMTESYQKPTTRLFLRERELGIILQERGVAFRPELNTTPRLLR